MKANVKTNWLWKALKWTSVAMLALIIVCHPWLGSTIAVVAVVVWATEKTAAKAAPACAGGCPRQMAISAEVSNEPAVIAPVPGKRDVMRSWVALF
jgi:hypothetical protein